MTYNPAGHRMFGLASPFLEHTEPVLIEGEFRLICNIDE